MNRLGIGRIEERVEQAGFQELVSDIDIQLRCRTGDRELARESGVPFSHL